MAYDLKPIYDSFEGGLVTKYEPNKLDANQSPDLINVNFSGRNSWTKRRGFALVGDENTDPGSCPSITSFRRLDGTQYLVRARDDQSDITLESLVVNVWTQIPTSSLFTTGTKFGFVTAFNTLYGGNGIEDSFKWDGTTYTQPPTVSFPKGNIFTTFQRRLFVAGNPATNNKVQYSRLFPNQEIFTGGVAPDISGEFTLDSEVIAMVPRNDAVIVYTLFNIFSVVIDTLTGAPIITNVSQSTGANTSYSTVPVENDIWSQDSFGQFRSLGERINYSNLRSDVQSVLIDKTTETLVIDDSASIYHRRQYLNCSKTSDSDFNNIALLWDADYGTWRRFDGINASCFAVYQDKIHYASSVDQNVYVLDNSVYNDNGGTIFSRYSFPNLTFGDALHWKRMRSLIIKGFISENAVITVRFIYDNDIDNAIIRTFDGSNSDITDEQVSISFGNKVFSTGPFGALANVTAAVPVVPFEAKISLPVVNFYECRVVIEEDGKETDYIITHVQPEVETESPSHFEPRRVI